MIYSPVKAEEFITFNEATGYEQVPFVGYKQIPKDFQQTALKIVDAIEKIGLKNVTGGANDDIKDSFNVYSFKVKENIEAKGTECRAYYFRIPAKLHIAFGMNTPNDYKNITHDILTSAGMKKGQQVGNGKAIGNYYYKRAKTNDNKNCYYLAWCMSGEQLILKHTFSIVLQIVQDQDTEGNSTKSWIESTTGNVSSENPSEEGFETKNNGFEFKNKGFAGMDPDEFVNAVNGLGIERSEELTSGTYEDFFRDPKVMEKFTEHMELSDDATRKAILAMNEAEQSAALTSLTSKLYDNIVEKIDDIDYGDIPGTKGDITKLPNYPKLMECIELLRGILKEFKQDTSPIDEISEAVANVTTRRDLFTRAFRYNVELPIIMYNNVVLSIINGVSYMIATSIEFIKTPNQDTFKATLDKVAYAKSKSNMLYNNLKKFNQSCKKGDFDKAMEHILQHRIKGIGEAGVIATAGAAIAGVASIMVILLSIIPILREMVFFFYYTRMRVSDFFDIQADLLQMNAYALQNSEAKTEEEKVHIVNKQLKIVELFRKIANKISFTGRKAEVDTNKEIMNTSKKMKIDDIGSNGTVSAIF